MPDEPTGWPYVTARCVKGEVMMSIPYLGSVSTSFPPHDYVLMAVILILIFLIEFRGGKEDSNERSDLAATKVLSVSGPMMHPAPAPNREID